MRFLADTTAIVAGQRRDDATAMNVREMAERGHLWICDVVELELVRGARNPRHMTGLREGLAGLRRAPIDDRTWRRAFEVYEGLARLTGGRHRGVPQTDLLIAAAAEAQELSVLHDDDHFDLIEQVTDQPMVRLP
jgi:predicted nucleic acid-binding protein